MTDERDDPSSPSDGRELLLRRWVARGTALTGASAPRPIIRRSGEPRRSIQQEAMLWESDLLPPRALTISFRGWLPMGVPVDGFEDGVVAIARNHEPLRQRFDRDSSGVELVAPEEAVAVRVGQADGDDLGQRCAAALARSDDDYARPFELDTGPLVRIAIDGVNDDRTLLTIVADHSVADGWSLGVAFHELRHALGDAVAAPSPPEIGYTDWAESQHERLDGGPLADQVRYWSRTMRNLPVLDLPFDRPRIGRRRPEAGSIHFKLDADLSEGLRSLAAANGVSLFSVVMAAWGCTVADLTGQQKVPVAFPVANRTEPIVQPLIGSFAGTLLVEVEFDPQRPVSDLLADLHRRLARCLQNQEIPLQWLCMPPHDVLDHEQLYRTVLNFHPRRPPLAVDAGPIEALPLDQELGAYDIGAYFWDEAELRGKVKYLVDVFDHTTAEAATARLLSALRQIVGGADRPQNELLSGTTPRAGPPRRCGSEFPAGG